MNFDSKLQIIAYFIWEVIANILFYQSVLFVPRSHELELILISSYFNGRCSFIFPIQLNILLDIYYVSGAMLTDEDAEKTMLECLPLIGPKSSNSQLCQIIIDKKIGD